MKRMIFAFPLLVFALCQFQPVQATLPFGPGVKNGKAAYSILYTDSLYINGLVGGSGMTGTSFSDSLKNLHPLIYADTLKFKNLYYDYTPTWLLPLPTSTDSTQAATDSLTVLKLAKTENTSLTYEYLHAFGNGTVKADTVKLGTLFDPTYATADSAVIMVRSSSGPGDSTGVKVIISRKGRAASDTSTVACYDINISTANTWEYFSIPLYNGFSNDPYRVEYLIWAKGPYWIEVGRVQFK